MSERKDYVVPLINRLRSKPMSTKHSVPQHQLRNDIQTLRAIAIFFVLLFHMWPKRVVYGFLGVDMFFVISGYLMCLILSKKRPLTLTITLDFYYRRIKRIVPLYYFVIFIVLLAVKKLISPIEFKQITDEATPALGFYSNIPKIRKGTYFDISSTNFFFLHSWSLSSELQFYAIVPMIFVLFDKLAKFRLSIKFLVISLIPIASFVYQCYAKEDFAHMLLLSRIWQFFVGFGAYHLRERRFFDLSQEDELSSQTIQQTSFDENKWNRRIDNTRIVLVHVLLIMFLVFGLPMNLQLQRLLVVVFTGIVVGSCSEITFVSKVRSLVVFGDISYSVYLIHWPLFTWYRYSNSEVYTNGGEPSLKTGFLLITVSIVLGYGIENAFKRFMKLIDGWKMLFFLICFLLYLNGIAIYSLRNSAVNLDEGLSDEKKPADAKQQLKRDIIMLWKTRTNPTAFTNDQITSYNSKQFQAFHGEFYCEDLNQTMPTTYPLNVKSNYQQTHTCHAKGFGAKNIILVGNSHALHNFPGVAYVFRPIYKHLTLLTRDSCLPTIRKFQATDPSLPHTNECMEFINATVPALQAWIEPIDVVMAFYAMAQNRPLEKSIEKDEYYMTMQKFFTELAEIPLEALMIMESFPIFSQVPIREVESRMKTGKPLNTVGDKPEFLRQRTPGITSRMEHIKCSNCIKLDLISFWCNRTQDNFCHSTTPQGIIYFVDEHHPSALGSFYNANLMYNLYTKTVV